MGRVEGKVAFITGAARGQGRSHAVRLAQEGADIIAVDVLEEIPGAQYAAATKEDLAETVRQVEAADRRIVAVKADVRHFDGLKAAVDQGVAEFGRLDIVCANAGISTEMNPVEELSEDSWVDMIDVNLSGVWRTCKAAIPHIRAGGRGGSIILTSSAVGLKAFPNIAHYVSAKHGVLGLMRAMAVELAGDWIRVNSIHPTNVDTPLLQTERMWRRFRPDLENPTREDCAEAAFSMHLLNIPWIDTTDVSSAVAFLASDEARYITGIALPIDAGLSAK
jgi:(+)-trans-carveol dehydrogenase